MHAHGLGGPPDPARAILLHTLAADAGSALSEMSLAYRYHVGLHVARDCDRSTRLYELAAHKGGQRRPPPRQHAR